MFITSVSIMSRFCGGESLKGGWVGYAHQVILIMAGEDVLGMVEDEGGLP